MNTQQVLDPRVLRTAPAGQFRVVTEDPADSLWPTPEQDCATIEQARTAAARLRCFFACPAIYDEHAQVVD